MGDITLIDEIWHTMKHARVFIDSKQKMHSDGINLYDELLKKLDEIVNSPKMATGEDSRTAKDNQSLNSDRAKERPAR